MGTWMCHLRIAEALLPDFPQFDPVAFSFGNLAPDSGVPNADWSSFDPPKEVTHFLRPGEGEGRIRDLTFYYTYVAPAQHDSDMARVSFLMGYFSHLLCENLWSHRIGSASKEAYAHHFQQDTQATWNKLKRDWYDLDHRYVRDHPASLFWRVYVPAPNPPMYVPLVPTVALHQQLDYIRTFYSQSAAPRNLDRTYPYLNEPTMTRFVTETARDIRFILSHTHQLPSLEDTTTALSLLDPTRLAPYDMPLGDVQ